MSNDKGTWFGWDVSKVGPVSDTGVYEIAKNFAERVGKGEIEAKPEVQEETKKSLNLQNPAGVDGDARVEPSTINL